MINSRRFIRTCTRSSSRVVFPVRAPLRLSSPSFRRFYRVASDCKLANSGTLSTTNAQLDEVHRIYSDAEYRVSKDQGRLRDAAEEVDTRVSEALRKFVVALKTRNAGIKCQGGT